MCSSARYLVIAAFAAVAASSATGSDVIGGVAAGVAVLALFLLERLLPDRFAGRACGLPAPTEAPARRGHLDEAGVDALGADPIERRAEGHTGIEPSR